MCWKKKKVSSKIFFHQNVHHIGINLYCKSYKDWNGQFYLHMFKVEIFNFFKVLYLSQNVIILYLLFNYFCTFEHNFNST